MRKYYSFTGFVRHEIYLKIKWFLEDVINYFFKYKLFSDDVIKFLGKNPYHNPKQIIGLKEAKNKVERELYERHDNNIDKFAIRDSKSFEDKFAWGIEFEIIDLEVGLGYKEYFIVDKETSEMIQTDYISENGLEILKEYGLKRRKK